MKIFNRLMQANPDAVGAAPFKPGDVVQNTPAGEQARAHVESKMAPILPAIIDIANKLNKAYGAFQQRLFDIVKQAETRAEAESFFSWVEGKVCEFFAIEEMGSKEAWDKLELLDKAKRLPRIAEVEGLSSWYNVKGKLLAGYRIEVTLGDEKEAVGALDPRLPLYAGEDGARQWLRDIADVQTSALKQYNDKLKAETDAKIALASGPDTDGGTAQTTTRDTAFNRARGLRGVDFDMPEMVIAGYNKMLSALYEAIKSGVGAEIIHGCLDHCRVRLEQEIVGKADQVRAAASFANRPRITKAEASERLAEMRRTQSAQHPELLGDAPALTAEQESEAADQELARLMGEDDTAIDDAELQDAKGG